MKVVQLGAYQRINLIEEDLGEQFTKSGDEPRTLRVELTTSMDEPFVNRTVTALLSEDAQRAVIAALQENLDRDKVMSDSPRWCAHCNVWGNHHTDRHPEPNCSGCGNKISANVKPWEVDGGKLTHPNRRCYLAAERKT